MAAYVSIRVAGDDSDDVTSEVFLDVFRSIERFTGDEDAFRAWVFTIARRRVADYWRAGPRRPATTDQDNAPELIGGDVEDDAIADLAGRRVVALLSTLTEEQREVLLLRVVADLSVEKTAEITGRSGAAVKALQNRAVRALRRSIEKQAATKSVAPAIPQLR